MKTTLNLILLVLLLNSCAVLKKKKEYVTKFETTIKMEYFRVVKTHDGLFAKDFNGVIYIHDNHILIKDKNDYRFNFAKEYKIKRTNGKLVRSWEATPYFDKSVDVYIEYKEEDFLFVFLVKKEVGYLYINSCLRDQAPPFPEYNRWYTGFDKNK